MKKMSKPIIVGNWKATPGTLKEATSFTKSLERKLHAKSLKKAHYFLAVPDAYIYPLSQLTKYGSIGAENITGAEIGQETGITTPSMLLSSGASFAILGHSEVRKRGETNEKIAHLLENSLAHKLPTILCIGEKERDAAGNYLTYIEEELKACLSNVKRESLSTLLIAYEPIWAIGGKVPATSQECFEIVITIRRTLALSFGIDYAKKVHILYGGTVNAENALSFIEDGGVDGLLIGRSSQEPASFLNIISACYKQ